MEQIEDVFTINEEYQYNKLIVFINSTGKKLTELRKLSFITKFDNYLSDLSNKDIPLFYFVFNLNKAKIPTNFSFIRDLTKLLLKHSEVIYKKLEFSVILYKSNLFYTFFNLFKRYYEPIKPLYLCQRYEDISLCIHNEKERSRFPEIISKIKKKG